MNYDAAHAEAPLRSGHIDCVGELDLARFRAVGRAGHGDAQSPDREMSVAVAGAAPVFKAAIECDIDHFPPALAAEQVLILKRLAGLVAKAHADVRGDMSDRTWSRNPLAPSGMFTGVAAST